MAPLFPRTRHVQHYLGDFLFDASERVQLQGTDDEGLGYSSPESKGRYDTDFGQIPHRGLIRQRQTVLKFDLIERDHHIVLNIKFYYK